MTSPILPFDGSSPLAGLSHPMSMTPTATGDAAAFGSELSARDRALALEAGSGTPPAEVLDQIAAAGRISRQLSESGHELRFSEGHGERVTVELADREGNTVRSMSISEALEIAAGKPLGDTAEGPLRDAGAGSRREASGGPSHDTGRGPRREAPVEPPRDAAGKPLA